MPSFAEQLAARAAEAKSHRERSSSNNSVSSASIKPNGDVPSASSSYGAVRNTAAMPGRVKANGDSSGGLSFADRIKMASPGKAAQKTSLVAKRMSSGGESMGGSSFAEKIRQKAEETLTPRDIVPQEEERFDAKHSSGSDLRVSPLESSPDESSSVKKSENKSYCENYNWGRKNAPSTQQIYRNVAKSNYFRESNNSILLPNIENDLENGVSSDSTPQAKKQCSSSSAASYPERIQRGAPPRPPTIHKFDPPTPRKPSPHIVPQTPVREEIKPSLPNNHEPDGEIHYPLPETEHETPTKVIFGAWAQIESLQQRVHEAEERAKQESHRAELAQYELRMARQLNHHHHHDHPHTVLEEVAAEDEVHDNYSLHHSQSERFEHHNSAGASSCGAMDDVSAMDDGSAVSYEARLTTHNAIKSTINTASDMHARTPITTNSGTMNHSNSRQCDQQYLNELPDSSEIEIWKRRALEAEERLAKERAEYSATVLAAPSKTTLPSGVISSASTISSHNKTLVNSNNSNTEETDLIRLKNAEIDVLRSQIRRLERRIQEECARPQDLLGSYPNHHSSPPLVVATAARSASSSSVAGGNIDEFRLLRDEIRNLQYELSLNKRTATTTTTSTGSTGRTTAGASEDDYLEDDLPTLSTLDGNEEVDDEDEHEGASSWGGLCCNVWRSKSSKQRGYGRTGVQPPGMT
ncbi:hypothetical protein ACHAXS_002381 [Conticribra weissflogii]